MTNKNILRLTTALALLMLCNYSRCFAQTQPAPKRELRAVWLTTLKNLDWPRTLAKDRQSIERQKQELRNILDKYQEANINTVLFQAVVRASTVYPSSIEPWDACMTGRFGGNPGYDPLAFAVEECHKRGMEIQAWIATLPVGPYKGPAATRLRKLGYKMFKFDADAFLDPSSEKTGDLVASLAREITTHYDIDGIHLDYIRYPEMLPAPKNEYIAQWRRNKITDIVRKVHDAVKAEKPYVKISCSPIGKYSDLSRYSSNNWNARDRVSQDAQLWLRLGLMDQLYPMIYFRGNNFYPFAADWAENSHGRAIAAGLGTYFLDPKEGGRYGWTLDDIARQMLVSRWLGLGTAHFRSKFFTSNYQGVYDFSSFAYAPYPALVPAMTYANSEKPEKPAGLTVKNGVLRIEKNEKTKDRSVFYNVYASDSWPVDCNDPRNLVLFRHQSGIFYLPKGTRLQPNYYAVTALDRYGNESEAVQSYQAPKPLRGQIPYNGKSIELSNELIKDIANSNGTYVFMSQQGQIIKEVKGNNREILRNSPVGKGLSINISKLPDGFYLLYFTSKYNKKKDSKVLLGFIKK